MKFLKAISSVHTFLDILHFLDPAGSVKTLEMKAWGPLDTRTTIPYGRTVNNCDFLSYRQGSSAQHGRNQDASLD